MPLLIYTCSQGPFLAPTALPLHPAASFAARPEIHDFLSITAFDAILSFNLCSQTYRDLLSQPHHCDPLAARTFFKEASLQTSPVAARTSFMRHHCRPPL